MNSNIPKNIKLNLGCFNRKIHGFINVDIRAEVNPDIVDNIFSLNKFKNQSIELIYCCHALEHLSKNDALQALKRWYDLLIYGGVLRLAIPDIEKYCANYLYYKDLDKLFTGFWGSQKHEFDYHKCGWDFASIKRDLEIVGFTNIHRYDWKTTEHFYIDDYSQAYDPYLDKEHGMLMSLNIEAIKNINE